MKRSLILVLSAGLLLAAEMPANLDKAARKKFDTAIRDALRIEEFNLGPSPEIDSLSPGLFEIHHNDSLYGYAWLGSAPGRYEHFDFAVVYAPDGKILKVEILVYRSDRGFEIMNKRWLSQFRGSDGCAIVYGKDIDALSGATLSGTSLVNSISENCDRMKRNAIFDDANPVNEILNSETLKP